MVIFSTKPELLQLGNKKEVLVNTDFQKLSKKLPAKSLFQSVSSSSTTKILCLLMKSVRRPKFLTTPWSMLPWTVLRFLLTVLQFKLPEENLERKFKWFKNSPKDTEVLTFTSTLRADSKDNTLKEATLFLKTVNLFTCQSSTDSKMFVSPQLSLTWTKSDHSDFRINLSKKNLMVFPRFQEFTLINISLPTTKNTQWTALNISLESQPSEQHMSSLMPLTSHHFTCGRHWNQAELQVSTFLCQEARIVHQLPWSFTTCAALFTSILSKTGMNTQFWRTWGK